MTGYEQFLVVVLSTFLAIFLLLGIIFLVVAIKVIKTVKRLTEKAEHLADRAEAVGDFFTHAAGPIALGRMFTTVVETVFKKNDRTSRSRRKD